MLDAGGPIERDVGTLRNATSVEARPWAQPDQRRHGSASNSAVYSDRSGSTSVVEDNRPDGTGDRIRRQERGYLAESTAIGTTATARGGRYPRGAASRLKINSPPKIAVAILPAARNETFNTNPKRKRGTGLGPSLTLRVGIGGGRVQYKGGAFDGSLAAQQNSPQAICSLLLVKTNFAPRQPGGPGTESFGIRLTPALERVAFPEGR